MNSNKSDNLNRLAFKSGSGYMLSNILIRSSAILTAPIFTRLLTTSDYGIAANFMAWQNIGLVIVGLGLVYSIGNAQIDFPQELDNYIASIQTLGSIIALLVLGLVIIFREQLAEFMKLDQKLVIAIFIYILFLPSVIFSQERYKFLLKYKQNIYISIFSTFGSFLFCLIFILYVFNNDRYYGRILGLIFPMFLMGAFFYINIVRKGWSKNIKKYWSYALKISIPMIPHSLAMVVLTQIDRIMIIKISGNSEAGLYSFGFSYAVLLMVFSNAVLLAFQPWVYLSYKRKDFQSIKSSNNVIALSMSALTILIITVGPEAIKILGAKEFWDAQWVVAPIAIGSLFQYVASTYSSLEQYHKKTIYIAAGSILAAILNYSLNSTFIPVYGYKAAAFTTFASYFTLALFHSYLYKKVCKKRVYDDKYIWIITTATALLGIFIMELYDYFFIRYLVLLFVFSVMIIFQKKKVMLVFEMVKSSFFSGSEKSNPIINQKE